MRLPRKLRPHCAGACESYRKENSNTTIAEEIFRKGEKIIIRLRCGMKPVSLAALPDTCSTTTVPMLIERDRAVSYQALARETSRMVRGLQSHGFVAGDRRKRKKRAFPD